VSRRKIGAKILKTIKDLQELAAAFSCRQPGPK
jgi:hypothetical protein